MGRKNCALKVFTGPINFNHRVPGEKQEVKDNIAFAKKFILTVWSRLKNGTNDTWAWIEGWSEAFIVEPIRSGHYCYNQGSKGEIVMGVSASIDETKELGITKSSGRIQS